MKTNKWQVLRAAAVVCVALAVGEVSHTVRQVEAVLGQLLYPESAPRDDVVLLDAASVEEVGKPCPDLATAAGQALDAGALGVVLDVHFGPTSGCTTQIARLADLIRRQRCAANKDRLVVPLFARIDPSRRVVGVTAPRQEFAAAAGGCGKSVTVGMANLDTNSLGGAVHRVPVMYAHGGANYFGLGVVGARLARGLPQTALALTAGSLNIGGHQVPLDHQHRLGLRLRTADKANRDDAKTLRGKLVFVGYFGEEDQHNTPSGMMPGVAIHAAATATILDHIEGRADIPRRVPAPLRLALVALTPVLLLASGALIRTRRGTALLALAAMTVVVGGALGLFPLLWTRCPYIVAPALSCVLGAGFLGPKKAEAPTG